MSTSLTNLHLSWCFGISEQDFSANIGKFSKLKSLDLSWTPLTSLFAQWATQLTELEQLSLAGLREISSDSFVSWLTSDDGNHLRQLTSLDISWCAGVNSDVFTLITSTCTSLVSLDMRYCFSVSSEALQTCSVLPDLRSLELSGNEKLTDSGYSFLEVQNYGNRRTFLNQIVPLSIHSHT